MRSRIGRRMLVAPAVAGGLLLAGPHVYAQNAGGAPSDIALTTLEEIVVTAQKREQRLNDVPITISAFNAESLHDQGARNLEDVANMLSGAQIFQNNGTGMPVWIVRGVGIVDFNPNNTPATAVYVDDVYQVSSVFGSIGLFDIERVEVLKGPQGGLYGRNTSGGAVRVLTRSPNLIEPEGNVTASYGRWERSRAEGGVSFPLITDKLAVRLSGRIERSWDGWQTSVATGRSYGRLDNYAVRAQLLAEPNDAFDVRVILDAGSDDSEIALPRARGFYLPSTGGVPPTCPAILEGRNDDSCLTFEQAMTGAGLPASAQSDNADRVLADPFSRNNNDAVGSTVIAHLALGDLTLNSVSGYREFDFRQRLEADGIPGEWGHQLSGSAFKAYSQELWLASGSDQPLTWIVGASYGRDTLEERRQFPARDNEYFSALLGSPLIFRLFYDQESESWAGFGQADYELTPTVTLSGAVRYTKEDKTYDNGGIGLPGVDNIFATPLRDEYELKSNWSSKLSIGWKPVEDSLLYASASQGFKTGGFFGGFAFSGLAQIQPYKEETVDAFEIGSKNTFAENRVGLNLVAFYYDYKDVQSFATEPDPLLGTVTRLRNVGDARHIGVELESFVVATRGLRFGASVAYLDAEIRNSPSNFRSAIGEVLTFNGSQRLFAPEWSWTAQAAYEFPIGAGSLKLLADANGRTTLVTGARLLATGEKSLVDEAVKHIPGYTLVNGMITYRPGDASWDVSLWGRNLTDKVYRTVWGSDGLGSGWRMYGEPRSYGVQVSMHW